VAQKDENMVVVTGPKKISGVRRRPCNIKHLEPLETQLEIEEDSDDETVEKAIMDGGLLEKFQSKVRLPQ
jgi:large subunit ribosomal protein L14e